MSEAKPEGVLREAEAQSRRYAKRLRSSMTEAELVLWTALRKRRLDGFKFRRQHPIGPYIVDFACVSARLVVEVDGATHSTEDEVSHDALRTKFLQRAGWRVLRVTNLDVFDNLNGVWLTIQRLLPPPAASPPPPPQAGEENAKADQ